MPGGTNVVPQNSNNRDSGSGFDPTGQQVIAFRLGNINTAGNGYIYGDQGVMIVDGGDIAQGTTSDTPYTGSGNATLIAVMKGLYAKNTSGAVNGYVAPTSPPSATAVATNTPYTFSVKVNHFMIQNNTTANVFFALDVSTATAATPVFEVKAGEYIRLDIQVTVLHLYTVLATNINSTSFTTANIAIAGWL